MCEMKRNTVYFLMVFNTVSLTRNAAVSPSAQLRNEACSLLHTSSEGRQLGVNTVPHGIQPGDYTFFLQVSEFYKREFLPTSLDLGHLRSRGKPQV